MTSLSTTDDRELLLRLQRAAEKARDAYHAHDSDGSVEGDLRERELQKAVTAANTAYENALDAHLRRTGRIK